MVPRVASVPTRESWPLGLLTPKRPSREVDAAINIFPYYAGFSYEWVLAKITSMPNTFGPIVDPWNGSGTSTLAASTLGINAVGIDLNPAVNVVATARLATRFQIRPVRSPTRDLGSRPTVGDPLSTWLAPDSVSRIRDWTRYAPSLRLADRSALLVAIFSTIRRITKVFEGSNPTWVRRRVPCEDLVHVAPLLLDDYIQEEYQGILARLRIEGDADQTSRIVRASASRLPMANESVSGVIGSPPYLTRIDYGVAYSRELAVLGIDPDKSGLRSSLMGTTKIRRFQRRIRSSIWPETNEILERIRTHGTKDSSGYYYKQASQYFTDLYDALLEITRVSATGAHACLVMQDSYYKDVPIHLADLSIAVMERMGWELMAVEDFGVPRLITKMNTGARTYSKGRVGESVITLRKGGL